MDNSQTVPTTIPQPVPEATTFVNPEQTTKASSSKMLVIIILVVLLLVAAGAGAYFWMSSQKAEEPVAVEQPTTIETADLSSELETNQPTDLDSEFSEIDKDLQSL